MAMIQLFRTVLLAALCAAFAVVLPNLAAQAVEPAEMLANPALEKRARQISAGVRCVVCQNQSIDDSNAPLAKDLRLVVRERLTAGDTDAQVLQYLVDRYGKFVLLKPPLGLDTILLWVAPLMFLGAGIYLVRRIVTTPAVPPMPEPLSAAEQRRLAAIVGKPEPPPG